MTNWATKHRSRREFLAQSAAALAVTSSAVTSSALTRAAFAEVVPTTQPPPSPLPFGSITAGGDLAHRTAQNFARLQDDIYRPPLLFRQTNWKSWPGDFEGRALLAVTLLSRATGQPPDYLAAMAAAYPAQLNLQGYFGPALDLHAINEQQLSGHGWFLRGLCEYYDYKRDPATLAQIQTIVRNLALPLRGSYAAYPIDPALRTRAAAPTSPGAIDGHLNGQQGDWAVSSDTGCAFIFLDGIAHAWLVLKAAGDPSAPALKFLIDEAVARFLEIDLVAIKAQTHASLTATRALLRIYAETRDHALLQAAQARYRLYRTTAMTEHYANINWFGRPDSWTEPCAIIDSFMVATQLWQHTGDPAYLEDAHLIWFNGVGRGLRANGGFGTDTCAGFNTAFVKVRSYEAYFCCTMRGGEGHARAAQYLYFTGRTPQGEPQITVSFFSNSNARIDLGHGPLTLRQTTEYPYAGPVRIEVVSAPAASPVMLRLFSGAPGTRHYGLTLNGRPVATSESEGFLTVRFMPKSGDLLEFPLVIRAGGSDSIHQAAMPGYRSFHAGPLLLGYKPAADPATTAPTLRSPDPAEIHVPRNATLTPTGSGVYRVAGTDITLGPINNLNDSAATPRDPCPRQVLFREA